jgi:acyl carrier protein
MNRSLILEKTLEVFYKVFGDSSMINEYSSADTIDKWDSLNHVLLIQELESAFGIKFDLFEIIEIRDVTGLVDYICSKTEK